MLSPGLFIPECTPFGLKARGLERFLWLDVQALSANLCTPSQTLVEAKYFTSRVGASPEKVKRQNTYLGL
jgi:hypothetical protein